MAVRDVAEAFLRGGSNRQIVSLGAGFDTTFFILKGMDLPPFKYCEVDYPSVCARKRTIIDQTQELSSIQEGYSLVGFDLKQDLSGLKLDGFDSSCPTLFISECFLVYLEPNEGNKLIEWAKNMFSLSSFIVYEPYMPGDPFGRTMKSNLKTRGISLRALDAYPDRESEESRYRKYGYHAVCRDMLAVYNMIEDKGRIEKIEWLDELEEWQLVMRHYCLVIASNMDLSLPVWLKSFSPPVRCLFLDMDGTLTNVKSPWQHVHEELGHGLWEMHGRPLLESWLNGDISYTDFCVGDAASWSQYGATIEQVETIIKSITVPEETLGFLRRVTSRVEHVCILSTGFHVTAQAILAKAGVTNVRVIANALEVNDDIIAPILDVHSGVGVELGKAEWCRRIQKEFGIDASECGAIGDSKDGDGPMFDACGYFALVSGPEDLCNVKWLQ